jgi:hypothetical protein
MRIFIALAVFFCGTSSPVFSDDSRPALLEQALSGPETIVWDASDWRYTMTISSNDGPIIGRFDGSQELESQWTLISPTFDALSDSQTELWNDTIEDDPDDDGNGLLFGVDEADMIGGDIVELSSTTINVTYGFTPDLSEDNGDDPLGGHIRGEVTVRRENPAVQSMRVYAPESFKPHPIARLNVFEMQMHFGSVEGLDHPMLQSFQTTIEGRAAFQSFGEHLTMNITDIEYLGH